MSDAAFLTVADTARLLGVSDNLVYELIARGDLPCATFKRRKMVPRRALDMILEQAMSTFDPARILPAVAAATGGDTPTPEAQSRPLAAVR